MSSVHEVRWRVIREHLVDLLRQAEPGDAVRADDETMRLAGGALVLRLFVTKLGGGDGSWADTPVWVEVI